MARWDGLYGSAIHEASLIYIYIYRYIYWHEKPPRTHLPNPPPPQPTPWLLESHAYPPPPHRTPGQWCTRECQMDESSEPLTTGPVVFLEGGGCFFSVGSNGNECMPGPLAVILAIGDMGPMYDVGQLVGPAYDPAYNE